MTDTIVVTESFRWAVMSRFSRWCQNHPQQAEEFRRTDVPDRFSSPVFSGKHLNGEERDGHQHARYLALPLDQDQRRIGTVAISAEEGFGPAEVATLANLRYLDIGRDDSKLRLQLQLIGLSDARQSPLICAGASAEWVSITPFLGHAHIGSHGQTAYLRKGIRREWRRLTEQHPILENIQLLEVTELTPDDLRLLQLPQAREFRRIRGKHGGRDAWRPGGLFRLKFSHPVYGPLCLGYGSHFGMGCFQRDCLLPAVHRQGSQGSSNLSFRTEVPRD